MICRDHDVGQGGFTFFEIALVLAIIVVVFAASAPLVSSTIQERRLRQSLQDIEQFVRSARLMAERDRREIDLTWQKSGLRVAGEEKIELYGRLSVRFPRGDWQEANGQNWRIFPSGIVAPATVRVQKGEAWIEGDIDPLTGGIAEERYSF